ncbi:MAG: FtsX-like permease family protein [Cyanobacteria bacterium CRU_2_1]|nr:FtsX-like permease family protein [Cyanobacteria bacterium CRU_2_1]
MFKKFFRKTPLAWLQVTREKTRLTIALAGIAFADILMFVQLGFMESLYDAAVKPHMNLDGDLFLINPQFENLVAVKSFPRERLYQAAGFDGVESINWMYIGTGEWRNPTTLINRSILIFGVDPATSTFTPADINQQVDSLKLLNRAIFDRAGRPEYGDIQTLLQQTNSLAVQVNDLDLQVAGIFTMGASFAADGNVIVSDSTFLRLFPEREPEEIDVGLIHLKPGATIEQVQATLQANLSSDVVVLTQEEFADREKAYWSSSTPIGFVFGFGAVIGFIVGTVIVYQILYSDVSDHLPEYATLKAMGYSDSHLVGILIQEALILAFLGFIPGGLLSIGLYHLAYASTLLPIFMTTNRAIMVLILTVLMCSASGAIAMRKLQAADPADIFQ